MYGSGLLSTNRYFVDGVAVPVGVHVHGLRGGPGGSTDPDPDTAPGA